MLRFKILSICTYISRCNWICTWFYIYICICQSKISSTTRVSVSLHFSSFIYCWLNYHCFNHLFSKLLLQRRAFKHQLSHTTKSFCLRETSQLSYFQPNQSKETSRFFLSWNNFQIFHPVSFLKLKLKQLSYFPSQLSYFPSPIIRCAGAAATDNCIDATLEEVESAHLSFSSLGFFNRNVLVFQKKGLGVFFSKESFRFFKSNFQVFQK